MHLCRKYISWNAMARPRMRVAWVGIRRFTRLAKRSAKKWENHAAAIMLWFAYCNFCRIQKSLRVTPSMEGGITGYVWGLADLLT